MLEVIFRQTLLHENRFNSSNDSDYQSFPILERKILLFAKFCHKHLARCAVKSSLHIFTDSIRDFFQQRVMHKMSHILQLIVPDRNQRLNEVLQSLLSSRSLFLSLVNKIVYSKDIICNIKIIFRLEIFNMLNR